MKFIRIIPVFIKTIWVNTDLSADCFLIKSKNKKFVILFVRAFPR